ncbi:hypothetical protein [Pedobacter sp. BAL39]|uniref:hypothetical protein n=1 Tax=Pedobacter sp. BAL39 TaxID=391596 RepID=UPI0018DAFA47|nr:hypothetical protein [Pedobacter sp. BAL39]
MLFSLLLPVAAYSQKAYETIPYAARFNGQQIKLTFADGYIGASEVMVTKAGRKKKDLFIADQGFVGKDRQLKFSAYKTSSAAAGDTFVLTDIEEFYDELPKVIRCCYKKGGKRYSIRFIKQ